MLCFVDLTKARVVASAQQLGLFGGPPAPAHAGPTHEVHVRGTVRHTEHGTVTVAPHQRTVAEPTRVGKWLHHAPVPRHTDQTGIGYGGETLSPNWRGDVRHDTDGRTPIASFTTDQQGAIWKARNANGTWFRGTAKTAEEAREAADEHLAHQGVDLAGPHGGKKTLAPDDTPRPSPVGWNERITAATKEGRHADASSLRAQLGDHINAEMSRNDFDRAFAFATEFPSMTDREAWIGKVRENMNLHQRAVAKPAPAPAKALWMQYVLPAAHGDLNPYVSDWVFRGNGRAKGELIDAYNALPPKHREALAYEVAQLVPGTLRVYRSLRPGDSPGEMGGASVSDDLESRSGNNIQAFEVTADDIMLHYGQPESWLSSKQFAHEHEIILRPDAKPRPLGPVRSAHDPGNGPAATPDVGSTVQITDIDDPKKTLDVTFRGRNGDDAVVMMNGMQFAVPWSRLRPGSVPPPPPPKPVPPPPLTVADQSYMLRPNPRSAAASELEVEHDGHDPEMEDDENVNTFWKAFDPASGSLRVTPQNVDAVHSGLIELANRADRRGEGPDSRDYSPDERKRARNAAKGLSTLSQKLTEKIKAWRADDVKRKAVADDVAAHFRAEALAHS